MKKTLFAIVTLLGVILTMVPSSNAKNSNNKIVNPSELSKKYVNFTKVNRLERHRSLSEQDVFDSSLPFFVKVADNPESTYSARVTQRDYDIYTSLPSTGATTILRVLDQFNVYEMFDRCPENSELIEFAESSNFLVQICLKETGYESTVFWMGYAKNGRGSLTLRIDENYEFWNIDTYYAIERRPLGENSYLLIGWPDGTLEAEALLYYYYPCFENDCG